MALKEILATLVLPPSRNLNISSIAFVQSCEPQMLDSSTSQGPSCAEGKNPQSPVSILPQPHTPPSHRFRNPPPLVSDPSAAAPQSRPAPHPQSLHHRPPPSPMEETSEGERRRRQT
ncbi:hypothetical protein C2845_PM15G14860 [Panicum miliaceum]|uniref:Uncharacterized protein n=1 Tax=Panicum miliaceum TaxID=4540 RepID=A0A3L6QA69_PANMI|nr:hypothetical protein C2845_PM15G14860 [Panicum miliaceum]